MTLDIVLMNFPYIKISNHKVVCSAPPGAPVLSTLKLNESFHVVPGITNRSRIDYVAHCSLVY